MFRYFLLICFLFFYDGYSNAQLPMFRHYTVNDGMPSNNVYEVSQDSRGFIWLCTDWGLSRFDGRHFENITTNDGLPDNEVFFIREDPWQRCWIFCYNKVPAYLYNGKVYSPRNDSLCRFIERENFRYNSIFVKNTNEFFLVGNQKYLVGKNTITPVPSKLESKSLAKEFFYKGKTYFLEERRFFRRDGNVTVEIAGIEGGAFRAPFVLNGHMYISVVRDKGFQSRMKIFYDIDLDNIQNGIKEVKVPYILFGFVQGKNGALWCCTDNGVYAYNPTSNVIDETSAVAMQGIVTYHCFIDRQGSCWYATSSGVYVQPPQATLVYNQNTGLKSDNVRTVSYMPDGKILSGYDNGLIDILDGDRVDSLRISAKGHWNRTIYLKPIDRNSCFVGTDFGLYKINLKEKKSSVINIYAQKSGSIRNGQLLFGFSGGVNGGCALYELFTNTVRNLPCSMTTNPVTATAIDANGTYWMGTLEGLYYCEGTKVHKLNRDSTLSHSRITSLVTFRENQLIVSTLSDGIFILEGERLHHIDKSNGLISNICKKVYVDEKDRIWVNTDKGLARITLRQDYSPLVYLLPAVDGIQNYMINDLALGGGNAYLATPKGIIVIDQDQSSSSIPHRVYILSVSLKDSVINYPEKITLSYKQNNVQISYTAISYTDGGYITYKYLLRGASTDTVKTGAGSLNLGALSPGNYELMVWGGGKNDTWNKIPAILHITVRPPFWQEVWFVACAGLLVLVIITLIYRRRVNVIRKKEKEKAGRKRVIAELEMQALRAQINPHFMFNALNAIQNYYNQNDELSANYYMTSFARLIRQTLSYSKEHWITIEDEMSMLKTYIELEQMRFKNAFTYEINVEPCLLQHKIPTMLLQTYTENAINHGLRHLNGEGGTLTITCSGRGERIICIIEDNGVGFEKARLLDSRTGDYKSMGLKITASRIETVSELYGTSITAKIIDKHTLDKNAQGTIIEIIIHNTPEV